MGTCNGCFSTEWKSRFQDDYDNPYTLTSLPAVVKVAVSERNIDLAIAAIAAIASALFLFALAWLITPTPGGIAKTAADALGKAALDPPTPSKAYHAAVVLPKPKLQRAGADPRLVPLLDSLAYVQCFALTDLALYQIESRILGARHAKSRRVVQQQETAYERAARYLVSIAEDVRRSIDQAIPTIREWPDLDSSSARKQLVEWRNHGLQKAQLLGGGKLEVDVINSNHLEVCVRSPELISASSEGFQANLQTLSNAVLRAAATIFRDRHRVLQVSTRPSSGKRKRE